MDMATTAGGASIYTHVRSVLHKYLRSTYNQRGHQLLDISRRKLKVGIALREEGKLHRNLLLFEIAAVEISVLFSRKSLFT